MNAAAPPSAPDGLQITVRYWASARAAAGVDEDHLVVEGPLTLAVVLDRARAEHPDPRFARVLDTCALMVDDRPASATDPTTVLVHPGQAVEVLPPFAGG